MSHALVTNGHIPRIRPLSLPSLIEELQPTPQINKLIGIFVPARFNNGDKVSAADLQPINDWVLAHFDGYTVYPHAEGVCNCGCPLPCRDPIHKIEIITEDSPALVTDLLALGSLIREHLDQNRVLITISGVEALYV